MKARQSGVSLIEMLIVMGVIIMINVVVFSVINSNEGSVSGQAERASGSSSLQVQGTRDQF